MQQEHDSWNGERTIVAGPPAGFSSFRKTKE
jgi:hypothetical protein